MFSLYKKHIGGPKTVDFERMYFMDGNLGNPICHGVFFDRHHEKKYFRIHHGIYRKNMKKTQSSDMKSTPLW